jgi:hypothetical protein
VPASGAGVTQVSLKCNFNRGFVSRNVTQSKISMNSCTGAAALNALVHTSTCLDALPSISEIHSLRSYKLIIDRLFFVFIYAETVDDT